MNGEKISISRIVAAVTPILLLLALIKHTFYYSFFNVSITNFLNLSEVILLFADDVLLYLILFVFNFLLLYFSSRRINKIKNFRFFLKFCQANDVFDRLYLFYKRAKLSIIILGGALIVLIILESFKKSFVFPFYIFIVLDIIRLGINYIVLEIKRHQKNQYGLHVGWRPFEIFFYHFNLLVTVLISYTALQIDSVKNNFKFLNTSFQIEDKIIKSDSSHYYVGNTSRYLFFYDQIKDETTIYQMERVKELKLGIRSKKARK